MAQVKPYRCPFVDVFTTEPFNFISNAAGTRFVSEQETKTSRRIIGFDLRRWPAISFCSDVLASDFASHEFVLDQSVCRAPRENQSAQ